MKKFLFQLNHPAHFHLFKNVIHALNKKGHEIKISIKDKDILKTLVSGYDHVQISSGYRKKNIISILTSLFDRDRKLYDVVDEFRPDLMIGTSPEIGHVSLLKKIPALFLGEDDVNLSVPMYLGATISYPFFDKILSPTKVNNSIWNRKTIFYNGFQKLAYLHPNRFVPDRKKVDVPANRKFFIIRTSSMAAYHDMKMKGIDNDLCMKLIETLQPHGEILISSERKIPPHLSKFKFSGNIEDIHHYLYFADLYIGDSQSMAVESAILGTPNIRFNDFAGKISVLEELENKYQLTIGIQSSDKDKLFRSIDEILQVDDVKQVWRKRRSVMLKEKIDVAAFFIWFIENYPQSYKVLSKNPEYQNRFK
ncbi:DUF354 domain-containing protein [Desulfotignum balticum]|uniref:DUF354 domain-containing protein n=1 Tax=Desulfotignum balticum TaxID=115781 RepID=UPI0003FB965A|nr:DUF354 domain-containing protein [Desulfotignum balticum]